MVRIKDPQPNVVRSLQWWVAAQECVQFVQKDKKYIPVTNMIT